ncbi:MAG: SipW-dependent-type signal peptide-containing protein, partial [Actinomycetota bacterium]|nr:SipW-dependent-type signal peptide-containing protein [Actinomycetota bacterium]
MTEQENKQSKARKLLLTAAVVGVIALLASLGTFAAFTDTTTNTGNQIQSGTVKIDQHAGAVTLYNVTNQKPGDSTSKCVRITYT